MGSGTTCGDEDAGTSTPPSKSHRCPREKRKSVYFASFRCQRIVALYSLMMAAFLAARMTRAYRAADALCPEPDVTVRFVVLTSAAIILCLASPVRGQDTATSDSLASPSTSAPDTNAVPQRDAFDVLRSLLGKAPP